jgi:alpha(1,3/1,4) fucosyltransferase
LDLIKLKFVDHYQNFVPETDRIYTFLQRYFPVELSDQHPDFIIYSSWGTEHLNYNCPKIFYTGENHRPNFFLCDYALGFDLLERENYLRVPLYSILWYYDFTKLLFPAFNELIVANPKSKFCCFISSNLAAKTRNDFFLKLSDYIQVDAGGKVFNNVGGLVPNKIDFMRPYKFCLAYENSSYPGYVTEKLMDCFIANCIPIYWGSPTLHQDFNPARILNRLDFPSDEAFIARIKFLNENETAYQEFIHQPIFSNNEFTEYFDEDRLRRFFTKIFEGPKETKSKGIRKSLGIALRNLKKLEARVKIKLRMEERIWY